MKAVVASAIGGPEVLGVAEVPEPTPGPGEVAIDVAFAGVNYVEIMQRRGDVGLEAPFVPGYEVAGHIRAVGEGAGGLRVGQPVAAMTAPLGGYAEVAVAPAAQAVPLDGLSHGVSLRTAAAFPTIVPTAYTMLAHVARLRPGETVLVHAAAGGVGTVAAQVARHLRAGLVVGTVGSAKKIPYAERAGYDKVFVRDGFSSEVRELTGGRGVDVVLDSVGGPVRTESLDALAPLGRLVIFGNASADPDVNQSTHALWFGNKAVMGFNIGGLYEEAPETAAAYAREALELVADGAVVVDVTEVLPLEQAAEAHRRVEGRATTGKLLLRVRE